MNGRVNSVYICPVFLTDDVIRTADYYVKKLGVMKNNNSFLIPSQKGDCHF